jgi:hypothetical protein
MNYPFISFCINEVGELVITHKRDPQRTDPLEMEIPLAQLQEKGFDEASRAIGAVALGVLSKWYPNHFANFDRLKPQDFPPS